MSFFQGILVVRDDIQQYMSFCQGILVVRDDIQQYACRSVRICGVKAEKKETNEDVEKVIKEILNDGEIKIPVHAMDRAHRIGKAKEDDKGNITQPIIVRFTWFRDRTVVYKTSKTINKFKYGVSLDLTTSRRTI